MKEDQAVIRIMAETKKKIQKLAKKYNYKDVTVLAALNKVSKNLQLNVFNAIKILPRTDALLKIKEFIEKKETSIKRIVHGNSSIRINTKGLSKDKKELILMHIKEIEILLKDIIK